MMNKRHEAFDTAQASLGLSSLDELAGTATNPAAQMARDREALDRRIAELPQLDPDRPMLEDPLDDEMRRAQGYPPRDPKTPSPAELARRHRDYESLIYRAGGQDTHPAAAEPDDSQRAAIMLSEFSDQFPELARQNEALTEAASSAGRRRDGLQELSECREPRLVFVHPPADPEVRDQARKRLGLQVVD